MFKKNPKLTVSFIISIALGLVELLSANAELLGISTKTLAIISFIVSAISYVWEEIKPEESLFTLAYKSIGGGGVKKPTKKED